MGVDSFSNPEETMRDNVFAVIMAGGRGTRFWPLSTARMPKQFLDLTGEGTMLQITARRFHGLCSPDRIMVVTGVRHGETVRKQMPCLRSENLLLEPMGRNTAPCIGWAANVLRERGRGSDFMIVVPSDHVIDDTAGFTKTMEIALSAAEDGSLVTVGIPPDRPATGYGYLHVGAWKAGEPCPVHAFREKPDKDTAGKYLAGREYLWNAGMFVWRVDSILEAFSEHLPGLYRSILELGPVNPPDPDVYGNLESISIDYGIMEKAGDVKTVPALFGWNDIGDWPSARKCGVQRGRVLSFDSSDCTVWNPGKLTVLLGVEGISVVETDGVTLVMSDSHAQELRRVVACLEESDSDSDLV